ncbi:MAG: H(+)-transporting two-sector ATPase, partial [Deltaproteobacteria bacterium]|nr:H(+)-transporting two-sector ATPase [Deltaproteobacteria bacterium]
MAIEPIKKLTILSPVQSNKRIMRAVSSLGAVDVTDAGDHLAVETGADYMRRKSSSTEDVDDVLRKIDTILNLLKSYAPEEQGFFQGLTPVPQLIDKEDLRYATESYDLEGRFRIANELDDTLRRNERTRTDIENRLASLMPLADIPFKMEDFRRPRRVDFIFGYIPRLNLPQLDRPSYPWRSIAWEIISGPEEKHDDSAMSETPRMVRNIKDAQRIIIACLKDDVEEVRDGLAQLSFVEIQLPGFSGTIEDHIKELREDSAQLTTAIGENIAKVRTFSPDRRALITLKAFWTAGKNERLAMAKTLGGKWVHILTGYIRERDTERLRSMFEKEFPESVVILEEPAPDENVPVSLTLPKVLRPLSLLVEMFGLPPYRSFDPTPYLHVNFYIFFGICFSDVGYGLMLIATSLYLIKRTKQYQGVADFGRILLMGGISTVIFGALLGSWFGDLYMEKYLGEDNFLMKVQATFSVLDPISKTIPALLIALFIGVMNQFFGISLKMYGSIRQGDWKNAFFDGFFWFLALPGLLIVASKLFVDTPQLVYRSGIALFGAGALGLILTQGRDLKNPVARILGGIVSLYGIMGSYGMTTFIGDVLSYCRLLALGLTTSIVGMTFNMLGGLLRDIPYVGIFLFII